MVDELKVHILRHRSLPSFNKSTDESDPDSSNDSPKLDNSNQINQTDRKIIEVVHTYVILLCVSDFQIFIDIFQDF